MSNPKDTVDLNEAPRFSRSETYELVDLSMSVATQFALQGKTAEAAAEVERAAIYLRELKRLHDGQKG